MLTRIRFADLAASSARELDPSEPLARSLQGTFYDFTSTTLLADEFRRLILSWGDPYGREDWKDDAIRSALRASGYASRGVEGGREVVGMLSSIRAFIASPFSFKERDRLAYFAWTLAAHAALGGDRIERLRRRLRT